MTTRGDRRQVTPTVAAACGLLLAIIIALSLKPAPTVHPPSFTFALHPAPTCSPTLPTYSPHLIISINSSSASWEEISGWNVHALHATMTFTLHPPGIMPAPAPAIPLPLLFIQRPPLPARPPAAHLCPTTSGGGTRSLEKLGHPTRGGSSTPESFGHQPPRGPKSISHDLQ